MQTLITIAAIMQQLGLHIKKDIIKGSTLYYLIFRWKSVNNSWKS